MTNWFYPAGSTRDGRWDVSLGATDSALSVPGWRHTGIKVATLEPGESLTLPACAEERIIVPLSGSLDITVAPGASAAPRHSGATAGQAEENDGDAAVAVSESAAVSVTAASEASAASEAANAEQYHLRGRADVFAGPSDVLYTGVRRTATVAAPASAGLPSRFAVALAPACEEYPTRLVRAEETPVELRGAGNCSRQVHNFGTPAALEADRFIVCEVLTPSGNWSSYPPHKHDQESASESELEEIYYFETRVTPGAISADEAAPGASASDAGRSHGGGTHGGGTASEGASSGAADPIGYARVYASDERPIDVNEEVRTGDVMLVPYGWHGPAMAAPGYDLYYLNVMAGPGGVREWRINDDPHHGWVRQRWPRQDIDPRLPFTDAPETPASTTP